MKKSIFGILIMMESLLLAFCAIVSLFYREGHWQVFLLTAAGALLTGIGCKMGGEQEREKRLTRADSFLVVTLSWVVFSIIGTIPYIYIADMDVSSAFFEANASRTGAHIAQRADAGSYAGVYICSEKPVTGGSECHEQQIHEYE